MVLLGTIVNTILIIIGAILGSFLTRIPESMKNTILKGIGIAVIVLGIQMGIQTDNFLIVIISIVLGAVFGEIIDLDKKFNSLGEWLEKRLGKKGKTGSISQGFVTASLIFVIGAMAVIGALDSGIRGDHQVLYTKGIIDGFTAIILTSTLGIGVIFSSIPVFLYQGIIALLSTQIESFVPSELLMLLINEITAVGGLMIVAIGLNLTEIVKVKVANFLPGLIVVAIIVPILYYLPL